MNVRRIRYSNAGLGMLLWELLGHWQKAAPSATDIPFSRTVRTLMPNASGICEARLEDFRARHGHVVDREVA